MAKPGWSRSKTPNQRPRRISDQRSEGVKKNLILMDEFTLGIGTSPFIGSLRWRQTHDPYFHVAYKNLLRKKTRSGLTVIGIALAAWVLVSLLGFNRGYESSLNRDIDNLGFQMIVTAKGCPYEAATLMLKGGTGLRYMTQEIAESIAKEPEVEQITPMLMQAVFDPNKGESGGLQRLPGR